MSYQVTVHREGPWWVAVVHGDGLPPHGLATQAYEVAGLDAMVRDVIILRTGACLRMDYDEAAHGLNLEWSYDWENIGLR